MEQGERGNAGVGIAAETPVRPGLVVRAWFGASRPFVAVAAGARRRPWLTLAVFLALVLATFLVANRWAAYHFRAAQSALDRDDYAEARRHLHLCLRVWRRSEEGHLLGARLERRALNLGQVEYHLRELKRIQGETSPAAQFEWVLFRVETGEVDQLAPNLLAEAERGGPEAPAIYEAVARAYCHELRFGQAWGCLNRWLEMYPDSPRALEWRGWVGQNTQQDARARADYARALELQPDRVTARLRIVSFFLDHNNPVDAEPHLDYLLQTQPRSLTLVIFQARCRLLQGQMDEAATLLDSVLAEEGDNETALVLRAEVEKGRKSPEKEEPYLRRAVALGPNKSAATLWALYQCLLAQKKEKEAAVWFHRHQELSTEIQAMHKFLMQGGSVLFRDPDNCVKVARTLFKIGHDRGALNYAGVALRINPQHAEANELLADFYERVGRPEQAEFHRQEARKGQAPSAAPPR